MTKIALNEESGEFQQLKKEWAEKTKNIKTTEELKEFIDKLLDYGHDYGTIVHAMWAAMMAAFYTMNNSGQGGITGFQAGFLGWMAINEFIRNTDNGARIIFYEDFVWRNIDVCKFVIDSDTYEKLQKFAKEHNKELRLPPCVHVKND